MKTSEVIANVTAALALAQAEFPTIHKDKTAQILGRDGKPGYSYRYANLATIFEAVLKILAKNGLAVVQATHFENGALWLTTRLAHSSGEWIEGVWPLKMYERPQDQGSALTYARRYALSALLGIATDEDDDGAAATKRKTTISPDQVANLVGVAKVAGLTKEQFLDRVEATFGHRNPSKIKVDDYDTALKALKPAE